ncbi:ral GTPase-activating protein subunit beta isoform X3 [Lutzomyia longipalpis]|uniref:ral GTPase-activating protein subunit beta isoform X3 n=1 Tax=Lutzomyia longipalpis TaxID=7200 RepID=UPI0024843B2E|nr:ral GTPase-activating protein subunit beta isoform X3 [Lutzomyia longipalpis]
MPNTKMYTEWASLSPVIASNSCSAQNCVLNKFQGNAGKDVAVAVVKQLASNLGISQPAEPSNLITDQEVLWCMDVICYGLSLPLNEHETIKDCVNVYCEWMTALNPVPRISVPKPIVEDPNTYARKIINHFHNLFVPRPGEGADTINRQAVLCHRVLRTLQNAAVSQILTRETWESLLLFLLAINEVLLAPPTIKDDVGDQLCERVLSVLFEVWLLACVRSYPSPSLWKTLQESCQMWRHRIALVEQWNRVNLALTARLIDFTYGSAFPEFKILDEDAQLIPSGMSNDCIAQTWYRFLRVIGNPTALCQPQTISNTPRFMQHVLTMSESIEPHQHPCLLILPQIFLKAIKGISSLVDAFLGILQNATGEDSANAPGTSGTDTASNAPSSGAPSRLSGGDLRFSMVTGRVDVASVAGGVSSSSVTATSSSSMAFPAPAEVPHSPTPPLQRRLAKSFSVAPSSGLPKGITKGSLIGLTSSRISSSQPAASPISTQPPTSIFTSMLSLTHENRAVMASARPKCNSILHLFGEWLFDAAHIGTEAWIQNCKKQASEASRRPSSMIMDSRKGSLSLSQPTSLNDNVEMPPGLMIDKFESGRAEAIGALCRIFCAKKTGEEILPVYLARFYMALQQGLRICETKECEETLASILYNSSDLFRLDLDGIQVLLPSFIAALELVLPEKELKMKNQTVVINRTELRRAAIHILISIIALPLHFQTLPIRDITGGPMDKMITFAQLKPRLINILMNALQVETDPQNTHMLLGGLLLSVQDSVTFEETEHTGEMVQLSPPASDMNLLSSACSEKSACSIASASSSLGGNSTATMGNEFPSLSISDDFPAEFLQDLEMSSVYDSAHALFVRATYLVCHQLISSWKTDLNVSLAALELLSGLARMHIKDSAKKFSDALECKRAVKWICDYICYQCSRPTPSHTKDLHSTIVAAFQCISAWLMQHPYLLRDKDCLTTVLEVVELGISGTKSVGKPGEPIKLKDEKELKPVSMRVRDAAECLLTVILEQVGYFPSECGAQSLSSLLDEETLMKYCNSYPNSGPMNHEAAVQKFRYFVTENSTILALLEEPLGNDQDPQPTITLIIRGPFGRHTWTMQLRHLPRSKSGTKYHHAPNPGRPVPMNDTPMRQEVEQKYFPDGVEKIPPCVADYSIPTLDEIIQKIGDESTKCLFQLLENQMVYEKIAWAETDNSLDSLGHAQEAIPPPVCHEFQAARLFLSHFGFLSIGENAKKESGAPLLSVLDAKKMGFAAEIQNLDRVSSRTYDTVYVFYVRAGQTTPIEIVDNMCGENVQVLDPHFWSMLLSLGWRVNVDEHAGWTGFTSTSWQINQPPQTTTDGDFSTQASGSDEMNFNGDKKVLYWADVNGEIAFVAPNHTNRFDMDGASDGGSMPTSSAIDGGQFVYERSVSECPPLEVAAAASITKPMPLGQKPRTLSLDIDRNHQRVEPVAPTRRRGGASKTSSAGQASSKIFLVWLESFEDHLTFPMEDLLPYCRSGEEYLQQTATRAADCHIIYLQALSSGLLRVKLQGPAGRMNFATPLVDGMVVSRRVVGNLVRQTAYNMARRRRLDNDGYQPPHVRRRLKVQEIVQKYKVDLSEPELLAYLFKS